MKEVALDVVDLPGRRLLCSGTRKMDRASGKHVRQVELRMPAMQLDPVAALTIVCNAGVGTIFGIYSVKFNHVDNHNETQIVVHAANVQTGQHLMMIFSVRMWLSASASTTSECPIHPSYGVHQLGRESATAAKSAASWQK